MHNCITETILLDNIKVFIFIATSVFVIWASYQMRKLVGCAWAGNIGDGFPATSKETVNLRSRHASRYVRHVRAVMHGGIANPVGGENVSYIPGACATRNRTYLVRGPWAVRLPILPETRLFKI